MYLKRINSYANSLFIVSFPSFCHRGFAPRSRWRFLISRTGPPHGAAPDRSGGVSPIIGGGSGSAAMVGAPCFRGGPAAANNILDATQRSLEYRGSLVRAARCLLGSVTRVLLLADTVVVKQLLLAKDKVSPPAVAPTVFFFFFFFFYIYFFILFFFIFFLRDFIFKKTLFEKLQYLKQEQPTVLLSHLLIWLIIVQI